MHRVLLLGAGKIGRTIAKFLSSTGDYDLLVADVHQPSLDRVAAESSVPTRAANAADPKTLADAIAGRQTVISALTFQSNRLVAELAGAAGASYFDLTEDVETARQVRLLSDRAKPGQIFMPQCGLAPGFVSILGSHLTRQFDSLDTVQLRVGALPQFPTNSLKYNLTWSTNGLINEYCNPCDTIHEGERATVLPLEGLEHFSLGGVEYEAFNTSGGLGTLGDTLEGKVRELNYKTCRYPGHRDLIAFLFNELRLRERRELLGEILEHALPVSSQDVVVIFCNVTGQKNQQFTQLSDARQVYSQEIAGQHWTAIQVTTAAGVCGVVDLHVAGRLPQSGFVRQEQVAFDEFIANRFGQYYRAALTTSASPTLAPDSHQ